MKALKSITESIIFVDNHFMEVTDELIENLADLACLEFTGSEKEEIKKDLQQMIAFIDKLNELDTTGVLPQLHMSDEINVLREDIAEGSISREEALLNAPLTDGVYFKVPKVIKNPSLK
jgi:aspartyl-tRNA(Asn)/glutamyl-tRNA(Gln) amidotransferase subunit C